MRKPRLGGRVAGGRRSGSSIGRATGVAPDIIGQSATSALAAIVAAMSVAPPTKYTQGLYTYIYAKMQQKLWSDVDVLHTFGIHDEQASRVNLVTPSKVSAVSGSPVFTADQGWTFDGASYLSTGVNDTGGNLVTNSASMMVFCLTNQNAGSIVEMGTTRCAIRARFTGDVISTFGCNTTAQSGFTGITDAIGMTGFSRIESARYRQYKNGVAFANADQTSAAPGGQDIIIGARNNAGTPASHTSKQISFAQASAGRTDTQMLAEYNLYNAFVAFLAGS